MTGPCIVWRCNGAASDTSGLCARHRDAPRPMTRAALAVADLYDPEAVARDSARHNARLEGGRALHAWRSWR